MPQGHCLRPGQRRGLSFGLSADRSFGREDGRTNRRKKKAALKSRPERRGFKARTGKQMAPRLSITVLVRSCESKQTAGYGVDAPNGFLADGQPVRGEGWRQH